MLEASHSGLVHHLGKVAGLKGSREFESLRLRIVIIKMVQLTLLTQLVTFYV
jgi:hypothetical protein